MSQSPLAGNGVAAVLIDPDAISKLDLYNHMTRLITPRPIAWVSTRSRSGIDNLAPYSYFNAVGTKPPTLMFCPANKIDGTKKDTLVNIESTGQFVVNIVSALLVQEMNQSSAEYSEEVSEFDAVGLSRASSHRVEVPRVAEALAAIECELHSVIILGTGAGGASLVIGRIVAIDVQDQCLDSQGQIDPAVLDTIGRMGGPNYATTRERFEVDRPTL